MYTRHDSTNKKNERNAEGVYCSNDGTQAHQRIKDTARCATCTTARSYKEHAATKGDHDLHERNDWQWLHENKKL